MSKLIDVDGLSRLIKALDARVSDAILAEEERARLAESELQESIDAVEDMMGGRTIIYLTQIEFDALSDVEKNDDTKAYFIIDAEEYNIWVGTTEELDAIVERDPSTIYFELDDEPNVVKPVNVYNGMLYLTVDRYQKVVNMPEDVQIILPEVDSDKLIEISLFFTADTNVNLSFSDNCKWRIDPNIEQGKAYEVICKYNTICWLVNIVTYS
jgi:hypothetical protein